MLTSPEVRKALRPSPSGDSFAGKPRSNKIDVHRDPLLPGGRMSLGVCKIRLCPEGVGALLAGDGARSGPETSHFGRT